MHIFFEIIKGIFFFLTIIVGIVFLRGNVIFGEQSFVLIKQVLMPGYLIFCGLIIGYLIAHIWIGNESEENQDQNTKKYIRSFIIGISIGLILAVAYILI